MKRMIGWMAAAFVVSVAGACGLEPANEPATPTECKTPGGTYTMSYVSSGGDCRVIAVPDRDLTVIEKACSSFRGTDSRTIDGCTMSETFSAKGTADGIEDGKSTIVVDCTAVDNRRCTAEFNVYFELR